ncbi:MAG: hypothetical protein AAB074_14180 [Planctomycetota bacterium]
MRAILDLADIARMDDEHATYRASAISSLEAAAARDQNAVIRERARYSLARSADSQAFEAWMRVVRPEEPELFDESLQMAERVADGGYSASLRRNDDSLEEHAWRALRLLRALDSARDRLGNAERILASKAILLRLAERAVLNAQNPATEREARLELELLRNDC